MAYSCQPGPIRSLTELCRVPARTAGPLGFMDHGDPNITSAFGDTPGPLGFHDWGQLVIDQIGATATARRHLCHASGNEVLALAATAVPTALTWEDIKADFKRWEALVTHMYLDTRGNLTVGVGNLLADVSAAQKLAFVRRKDGAKATAEEIKADFNKIIEQDYGNYKASWYRDKTALDLPETVCWKLLKKRIDDDFIPGLQDYFTGWASLPLPVKRALLDMAYNLGLGSSKLNNGLRAYKNLKKSVDASDWKGASTQCRRRGIPEDRNDWTRDLFLEAAAQKK